MLYFNKRAISPLIATILLVVVAVAIIAIVVTWSKDFTLNSLEKTDNVISQSKYDGFLWSFQTYNNNVLVENKSDTDINITGYTINSLDHNGFWINSYHLLEDTLTIKAGQSDNIPLICMPSSKFLLNLRTTTNENVSINIKPNLTTPGDSCEEYNVSLWDFVAGTGTYTLNEYSITEGELVTNGDFETDLSGWLRTSHIIQNNGVADINFTGNEYILEQQNVVEMGKNYLVTFEIKNYYSGAVYFYSVNLPGVGSGYTATSNGVYTLTFTPSGSNISFRTVTNFVGSIDNISIIEIPPLPDFNTGTKYLQNTTAGTTAIESKQAYGTWEFDVYKGVIYNDSVIQITTTNSNTTLLNGSTGYGVRLFPNNGVFYFYKGNGPILSTASSYLANNIWYRIKVARLHYDNLFNDLDLLEDFNFKAWEIAGDGNVEVNSFSNYNSTLRIYRAGLTGVGQNYNFKINGYTDSNNLHVIDQYGSSYYKIPMGNFNIDYNFIATGATRFGLMVKDTIPSNTIINKFELRRIYPVNTFAVFIKGGSFGDDNWTLVSTTGGSGSNPVTDSTYTSSNYFVADLDAGDRIANIKMKESVD